MAYTIPNELSDLTNTQQAEVDKVDFDIIANSFNRTGVIQHASDECAVTFSSALIFSVAAGTVLSKGARGTVSAGNVTLDAADSTNPRFDLIVVTVSGGTGTKTFRKGTASSNPVFPTLTDGDVVLASVYVPAGESTSSSARITDKRMIIRERFEMFDVHDYGALGDDSTDDRAAIQRAIDAAYTNGGGIVYFHSRTYRITTSALQLKRGVQLVGQGRGSIIKQMTSGIDGVKFVHVGTTGSVIGTVSENVDTDDTTFDVTNSGSFTAGSYIICPSTLEIMLIDAAPGDGTITVFRGMLGSTAASMVNGLSTLASYTFVLPVQCMINNLHFVSGHATAGAAIRIQNSRESSIFRVWIDGGDTNTDQENNRWSHGILLHDLAGEGVASKWINIDHFDIKSIGSAAENTGLKLHCYGHGWGFNISNGIIQTFSYTDYTASEGEFSTPGTYGMWINGVDGTHVSNVEVIDFDLPLLVDTLNSESVFASNFNVRFTNFAAETPGSGNPCVQIRGFMNNCRFTDSTFYVGDNTNYCVDIDQTSGYLVNQILGVHFDSCYFAASVSQDKQAVLSNTAGSTRGYHVTFSNCEFDADTTTVSGAIIVNDKATGFQTYTGNGALINQGTVSTITNLINSAAIINTTTNIPIDNAAGGGLTAPGFARYIANGLGSEILYFPKRNGTMLLDCARGLFNTTAASMADNGTLMAWGITRDAGTITFDGSSGSGIADAPGFVQIGGEIIYYAAKASTTISSLVRGALNTTASPHADNGSITRGTFFGFLSVNNSSFGGTVGVRFNGTVDHIANINGNQFGNFVSIPIDWRSSGSKRFLNAEGNSKGDFIPSCSVTRYATQIASGASAVQFLEQRYSNMGTTLMTSGTHQFQMKLDRAGYWLTKANLFFQPDGALAGFRIAYLTRYHHEGFKIANDFIAIVPGVVNAAVGTTTDITFVVKADSDLEYLGVDFQTNTGIGTIITGVGVPQLSAQYLGPHGPETPLF